MAKVIADSVFKDSRFDIETDSAGTHAYPGDGASENAVIVAKSHGLDLSGHTSKPADRDTIASADLILTMAPAHKDFILNRNKRANAHTLCEYAGYGKKIISDPYGGDLGVYEACFNELEKYIKKAAQKILENGVR